MLEQQQQQQQLQQQNVDEEGASSEQAGVGGGGEGSSLSPEEEEYFRLYGDMLAAYKGQWTDVDLTGSLEPPQDLFIDVRVLKDAGEIQTEYGYSPSPLSHFILSLPRILMLMLMLCRVINLTKNSQLYVRQGDVERLIAQGFLERLS